MDSLLDQLRNAVQNGTINNSFTTNDLKTWIDSNNIINPRTNQPYSDSYIDSFLSSSTINSTSTKSDKDLTKLGTTPESYRFQ